MEFTTLKIAGSDAIRLLGEHRSRFPITGIYPFLIGDAQEIERVKEAAGFHEQDAAAIIDASLGIDLASWMSERREETAECRTEAEDADWFGGGSEDGEDKGSIMLHKDIATGELKPDVYLGLAKLEQPWHLPAVVKFGSWNDCPPAEVHCALLRTWQERYGAEITGMSTDIVECEVKHPPTDREAAAVLAWEQYWYCADIVEQGVGSVSNLAATLLNSPYWFFWWD